MTDIYATAYDYSVDAKQTRDFFAKVQNKMHYAVQGKLVDQDPNEEPASVLLERIREELHASKIC